MTTMQQKAPSERRDASNRRAWWIAGGVLTAVVMAFALAAAGVRVWTVVSPTQSVSHTETYTGQVAGVEVDLAVGQVALTAADGPDLEVAHEATWRGPEPGFEETLREDGTVTARAKCAEDFPVWVIAEECEISYSVAVPSGAGAAVRTSVAPIEVEGLDGDLELESSVGKVDARNLRTSSTAVSTDVGDIVLAFDQVLGDIEVTTSVGDVIILVPDDGTTFDVEFDSAVGEDVIAIATDPTAKADYRITVRTSVGNLEVRYLP